MPQAQLDQLAAYLAGEFDNKAQSLADPTWFLHLRLWHRPLTRSLFDEGYGFFIEQAGVASGKPPYRQRILHITEHITGQDAGLGGQYYALSDPAAYSGSATQPERLASLTRAALIGLPTCRVAIEYQPATQSFSARLPGDSLCSFTVNGVTTSVRLKFDIGPDPAAPGSPVVFQMEDRGIDPDSGKTTWGPQMGPFQLVKHTAFALLG